ncbi:glycoside hydrolase domain-containing protein [Roseibium alexandrii]|uniref:glycoside hydrolase domain-containing protein n=1 Tax=Roseibium alexandrii TaxID=388408 RepID=UPI003995DE67
MADTHFPVTDKFLRKMKTVGVSTIARYYDWPEQQTLPNKLITPGEAKQIRSYGFNILTVFQHNNGYGRTFKNWKWRGPKDATVALSLTKTIDQPKGTTIYFGVDSNMMHPRGKAGSCGNGKDTRCNEEVISYFSEVNKTFNGSGYNVGVYGSGLTCKTLKSRGLVKHCWISQSTGHYGTKAQLKSGEYDIHQLKWDKNGVCAGRWLNFSRRQDNVVNYGQFK